MQKHDRRLEQKIKFSQRYRSSEGIYHDNFSLPIILQFMWKYVRLFRLQDQYLVFGGALAAGILLNIRESWIVLWAVAVTAISISSFILNEIIDSRDVDFYSWNPIHMRKYDNINLRVAWVLSIGFTIMGLVVALLIGLFWWALLMALWYGMYSWPSVRLKTVIGVDILTQVGAGWVIPFGVPFFVTGSIDFGWTIIVSTSFLGWSIIFPYQLADFTADKRAGFGNTHVILGMKHSLWFGVLCSLVGVGFFLGGFWHMHAPWLMVFPFFSLCAVVCSIHWLQLPTIEKQELAFRRYVAWMKPATQLLLPYIILLWFIW